MRILLINHYAGSTTHGMEYRPYYLAREWVRLGHKVKIVASSQSHVRTLQPKLNKQYRLDEVIDGVHYTWLDTPAYTGNGIRRLYNIATFIRRLYQERFNIAEIFEPDIVISSSTYPMDIWPARRIAKLVNAKLLFEVHDLWPLSLIELGRMSKWHPFVLLIQLAEGYAYFHSDIVVSMLPKARKHMESRGMAPHKLHIIPNGVNLDDWITPNHETLPSNIHETLILTKNKGHKIIGYIGSHGIPNALDTLLDAAALMKNDPVLFVLVGNGHEKERLATRVKSEKLSNVKMFSPISKKLIPKFLSFIDIGYIGAPKSPLYRFGVSPNKIMDYMMAKVPIIYAIEAGNDYVAEASCGISIPAENCVSLVNGILQLLNISPSEIKKMGENGKKYVMSNLTYDVLAKKFIDVI